MARYLSFNMLYAGMIAFNFINVGASSEKREEGLMLGKYAVTKLKITPKESVPDEVKGLSGKGFVVLRHGMYWRDVSKTFVDLEKRSISYDFYRYGEKPDTGNVEMNPKELDQLILLCNKIWASPKDNNEKSGDPLLVGIEYMNTLVLVDNGVYRVIGFSTSPLDEVSQISDIVQKILGGQKIKSEGILDKNDALKRARAYFEKALNKDRYDWGMVDVREYDDRWEFWFPTKVPTRPAHGAISVSKISGDTAWLPLR